MLGSVKVELKEKEAHVKLHRRAIVAHANQFTTHKASIEGELRKREHLLSKKTRKNLRVRPYPQAVSIETVGWKKFFNFKQEVVSELPEKLGKKIEKLFNETLKYIKSEFYDDFSGYYLFNKGANKKEIKRFALIARFLLNEDPKYSIDGYKVVKTEEGRVRLLLSKEYKEILDKILKKENFAVYPERRG